MRWRAMEPGDLDGVAAVARVAFPDHPEDRACFAERLALCPSLCWVLDAGGVVAGYLIAYPWPLGAVPPLNALLGSLPAHADAHYLHDLALLPAARGGGHAAAGLALLFARVATPIALVSVNESAAFWRGHGFAVVDRPDLRAKLFSYGDAARYMVREPARG
ncbi:GNAT family N-acetyltransferase [Sphingomonas hengshuiensis]|uniref:N-acetyltransferase domain-containing protein n=1 Tax=Sphingomonas hengshuiensis TaxID=1609977 RepID=A0A7U4LGH3_9SPHN|nr:GNAT family N-acetyltransferase [Sphingomonas hengshuiensis]AJP73303.1 hypothetical protein TS85_18145 [Sphingomonas hengshuiensis]